MAKLEDEKRGRKRPKTPEDADNNSTKLTKNRRTKRPDDDSDKNHAMETEPEKPVAVDAKTESEEEASDVDQENDLKGEEETEVYLSKSKSSFNVHLSHLLSKEEVDDLTRRKWKFEWRMPAFDISSSKWEGTGKCFLKDIDINSDSDLKLKLYEHWLSEFKVSGGNDFNSSRQKLFFTLCNSYRDILHCNKKPFYLKGSEEDSSIMDAYIMHALNHVFRSRDFVTRNKTKLTKLLEKAKEELIDGRILDHGFTRPELNHVVGNRDLRARNEAKLANLLENTKEEYLIDGGMLDHGFTRPKVLIVLPLASIALRFVERLIQLTPPSDKVNVEHFDRFSDEFTREMENPNLSEKKETKKPSDWQALFGGNNNDNFLIGIKFTRRSVNLYSDFYSSDIILASPLGLIDKIGLANDNKEKDVDYLSSIEVLIVDHADVILLQNWGYLDKVVKHLNQIPRRQHGTNIMRIRKWYLNGHAPFYRQTIILGSLLNPDINGFFHNNCLNYQGKVRSVTEHKGVLAKVLLEVRQVYERFDVTSFDEEHDARFNFFTKKVFPKINHCIEGGTMIICSYFEYTQIRTFLKSQNASFCTLQDFSKPSDISRARVWFFEGKKKIMIYTERAHFYRRYKIRGVKNLIFYSLPERKEFYPEIVNMLEGSDKMECTVLFSSFDKLKLKRIVGDSHSKRMLLSDKSIFVLK